MADKTKRIGELKVRTITERRDCRDRTTVKHLQRINLDRAAMKIETAAALPKQAQAVFEENRVLLKKAKRLGG